MQRKVIHESVVSCLSLFRLHSQAYQSRNLNIRQDGSQSRPRILLGTWYIGRSNEHRVSNLRH